MAAGDSGNVAKKYSTAGANPLYQCKVSSDYIPHSSVTYVGGRKYENAHKTPNNHHPSEPKGTVDYAREAKRTPSTKYPKSKVPRDGPALNTIRSLYPPQSGNSVEPNSERPVVFQRRDGAIRYDPNE